MTARPRWGPLAATAVAVSATAAAAARLYGGGSLVAVVVVVAWLPTLVLALAGTGLPLPRAVRVARLEVSLVASVVVALTYFRLTTDSGWSVVADVVDGVRSGVPATARTAGRPSPAPELAAWLPVGTALAATIAAGVVERARSRVGAVFVVAVLLVGTQVMLPASGVPAAVLGAVVTIAAVAILAREQRQKRLTGAASVAVVVALAAAAAAAAPHRDEPYRYARPPLVTGEATRNPLDTIPERLAHPADEVFRARSTLPVRRWRVAVLDQFDGAEWNVRPRFVPLVGRLARDPADPPPAATGEADIDVVAGATRDSAPLYGWLPVPARPLSIRANAPVLVEPHAGSLRTGDRPVGSYRLTWQQPPAAENIRDRALFVGTRSAAPDIDPELVSISRDLVGDSGHTVDAALRIADHLRRTCRLVTVPQVAGHRPAHIIRFLTETRRGTHEQFAVAFADLAAAAGIPVRVVVGFRQPEQPDVGGEYVIRNRDVYAWPEIRVSGIGWYAIDAAPGTTNETNATPPASPTPSASRTPPPASPSSVPTPGVTPTPTASAPPVRHGRRKGIGPAALAAPMLGAAGAVPVAKLVRTQRRRRRRGRSGVVAAWYEAVDWAVDHGIDAVGATPHASAGLIAATAPAAAGPAAVLAAAADRALWSASPQGRVEGDMAWNAAAEVRRALARRTRTARARAWYSTASFRSR